MCVIMCFSDKWRNSVEILTTSGHSSYVLHIPADWGCKWVVCDIALQQKARKRKTKTIVGLKIFKKSSLQMFCEGGNTLGTSVQPQCCTERKTLSVNMFVYKETPRGHECEHAGESAGTQQRTWLTYLSSSAVIQHTQIHHSSHTHCLLAPCPIFCGAVTQFCSETESTSTRDVLRSCHLRLCSINMLWMSAEPVRLMEF